MKHTGKSRDLPPTRAGLQTLQTGVDPRPWISGQVPHVYHSRHASKHSDGLVDPVVPTTHPALLQGSLMYVSLAKNPLLVNIFFESETVAPP